MLSKWHIRGGLIEQKDANVVKAKLLTLMRFASKFASRSGSTTATAVRATSAIVLNRDASIVACAAFSWLAFTRCAVLSSTIAPCSV